MSAIRTLVTGLAASAMVAVGLVSPGAAWADAPTTIPTITSPADGATVSGVVDVTVTTSAPRVALLVDSVQLGIASPVGTTATFHWTTYGAEDGPWTIEATDCSALDECSADGHTITVTLSNLHPAITSQLPNPFGPNANAVKDTTTTTYLLADTEAVTWTALAAGDVIVRGPVSLGTQTAGTHSYVWNGKNTGGMTVPDGKYTVRITGTNGARSGVATTTVVVDSASPTMAAVVGAGLAFYPYPDGFKDTYTPTVLLNEPATLTLTVRTKAGSVVRRIAAAKAAGRVGLAWNGRNAAGKLQPAGAYRWAYTAIDRAGNTRSTSTYTVTVSLKRLVSRTVYATVNASKRISTRRSSTCTLVKASTYGSTGLWLYNGCDVRKTGSQYVELWFSAALPAAVSYGTLTLQMFGHTHSHAGYEPVSRAYGWIDRTGGASWVARSIDVRTTTARWYSVVAAPSAGFMSASHRVAFGFGVSNHYYPPPNEVDVRYVRIAVSAKVLV